MANFTAPRNPEYAMPKDTAEFHSFIDGQLASPTGCLATDYRNALASAQVSGEATSRLSLNDEFQKWWDAGKPYTVGAG